MKPRAVLVALAAWLAFAAPALACSCADRTPEEMVAETELIFIGTARTTVPSDEEGSDTVYTVFKARELLKGEGKPGDEIYVFHPQDTGANCGVDFADGKEVLVLAHEAEDGTPPTTNSCSMIGVDEAAIRAALKKKAP